MPRRRDGRLAGDGERRGRLGQIHIAIEVSHGPVLETLIERRFTEPSRATPQPQYELPLLIFGDRTAAVSGKPLQIWPPRGAVVIAVAPERRSALGEISALIGTKPRRHDVVDDGVGAGDRLTSSHHRHMLNV
jgi:hypothetical protein